MLMILFVSPVSSTADVKARGIQSSVWVHGNDSVALRVQHGQFGLDAFLLQGQQHDAVSFKRRRAIMKATGERSSISMLESRLRVCIQQSMTDRQ